MRLMPMKPVPPVTNAVFAMGPAIVPGARAACQVMHCVYVNTRPEVSWLT